MLCHVTAQLKWIKQSNVYTEGSYVLLSEVIIYKLRSDVREELKKMETEIDYSIWQQSRKPQINFKNSSQN